jgi:transcription antitermination factor NusG
VVELLISPDDPRSLWLLVKTKPKMERIVVEGLVARGVEGYVPRILEPRAHSRAPLGPAPLFPSYAFARCVVKDRFNAVHYCPGALGVVRFADWIAAIEDDAVADLRQRESERGYLVIQEVRKVPRVGARARVESGPLKGFEGMVTRYLPAKDRVRLLLSLVSGVRNVEIDVRHMRVV